MAEAAYPLQWPLNVPRTPPERRKSSYKFKMSFAQARYSLVRELRLLGAGDVVLSSNIEVRRDGLPYADFKQPADPGLAVYFTHEGQRVCIACDTYDRVVGNLRGLGITIESLRSIELHNSSQMVRAALVGFRALPAQASAPAWCEVLGVNRNATADEIKSAYRRLALQHHPDRGGIRNTWDAIQHAYNDAQAELERGGR